LLSSRRELGNRIAPSLAPMASHDSAGETHAVSVHVINLINQTADHLHISQPLPQQLSVAYDAFGLMEYAVRHLAYLDQCEPSRFCARSVLSRTAQARAVLARAPTFTPPASPPPHPALAAADDATVVAALTDLADTLVLALVEIAHQAHDDADVAACLQAAIHACHLYGALNGGVEARDVGTQPPQCLK
jgi:hypothetical protein